MPTVIGVFNNRSQAEKAVSDIRTAGISEDRVSIVARGNASGTGTTTTNRDSNWDAKDIHRNDAGDAKMTNTTQDLSNGTTTGGAIGGVAGLLAGAGLLTIPGVGPILALGPIVSGLAGAAVGGVAGALVDLGISPNRSKFYQSEIEQGGIVAAIQCDQSKIDNIASILRNNGAKDVETY